jgi:hypothetical protein|tara:strand:+ start:15 stop:317 length:303 start_codon:yes stop_codon:yes gene_type:complete
MAKRKTPKTDQIIDLKPKAEKITPEQLAEVQGLVSNINRAQMEIGSLETRKHQMLHSISTIQESLVELQAKFEKEYGTIDINIQDGTINYESNVEANKKD